MTDETIPADDTPQVDKLDDGSVEVTLQPEVAEVADETFNLVPVLDGTEKGKKFLKELAERVAQDVKMDWDSCSGWRDKRKKRWQLLVGDIPPKSYPFDDSANVHLPIMLERVLRLVHRLYAEMFPDRDFFWTALPSSSLSQERADILTLDTNWQFRREIPDWMPQNRRGLMEYVVNGDAVFFSYRDFANNRNRHECLTCEEVVFPYHWKTSMVDMSDIPRKTRFLRKYRHELVELERLGRFHGVDAVFEAQKHGSHSGGPETTIRDAVDKYAGRDKPDGDKNAPYFLYEYHGWAKVPGMGDSERPITATVEPETQRILCLYMREQEDWKDRARFDREMAEAEAFSAASAQFQQLQVDEQVAQQRLAQPDVPPDEAMALQEALAAEAPVPPTAPPWMQDGAVTQPKPVRRVPIECFSHAVCIENPDGSMGLGIGMLLEEFNKAGNVAASQFTDSATLSNVVTAFMPEGIKLEPGDTELTPGKIHRVQGLSAEQIQNAIKIVQFPPANPQLLEVIRMVTEAADGVSSAPDVLSGEPGKANETYRGIATRVEQATKQLTVLALNYMEMLNNVVKNNSRLNANFMDDDQVKTVVDPRTLETVDIETGRQLYAEDYEIAFTADVRFGGRAEKIAEADQLLGMFGALPPDVAMMVFPPSYIYEAVVRALKARGMHDMVKYLGPRPPIGMPMAPPVPPPPPMGGPPPPGGPPPGGPPIQGPPAPPIPQ